MIIIPFCCLILYRRCCVQMFGHVMSYLVITLQLGSRINFSDSGKASTDWIWRQINFIEPSVGSKLKNQYLRALSYFLNQLYLSGIFNYKTSCIYIRHNSSYAVQFMLFIVNKGKYRRKKCLIRSMCKFHWIFVEL